MGVIGIPELMIALLFIIVVAGVLYLTRKKPNG